VATAEGDETQHGAKRRRQAKNDPHRAVGDPNRIVREGVHLVDVDTDYFVYVLGNRVVVTDESGARISQFKNSAANTRKRIQRGRWVHFKEDK
jgi:hypothetical protein